MTNAGQVLALVNRRGWHDGLRVLPAPSAPLAVARELVAGMHTHQSGALLLRHWRGGWWEWQTARWAEIEHRAVRKLVYGFTEHAVHGEKQEPWAPTRRKVDDLLDALAAVCHISDAVGQPSWVHGVDGRHGVIVACENGLLDVGRQELLDHDPRYFNGTAVPFAYDPHAGQPTRWLGFLTDLWGEDGDQAQALQEWFGYVISGRLDLHKILLVVGPTRAGKGTIARVLGALIGLENVAGPTLSSLQTDFGLAPLIGKPLAVVSDARLNGRDSSTVVERLLSISGEDTLTVNRKYRDQWTGKLPCRFLVCSNELPRLGDASAAIAGRFVTLLLERSWLGREDPQLEDELRAELPAILNWALGGLARLADRGKFTRPASTDHALVTLQDLASPVRAFLRDQCVIGAEHETPVDTLWKAWRCWAEDNGHGRGGTKQTFGRDLRAALPAIRVLRPREGDERQRVYVGLTLRADSEPLT